MQLVNLARPGRHLLLEESEPVQLFWAPAVQGKGVGVWGRARLRPRTLDSSQPAFAQEFDGRLMVTGQDGFGGWEDGGWGCCGRGLGCLTLA